MLPGEDPVALEVVGRGDGWERGGAGGGAGRRRLQP
jgi:hypothetical protein